MRVGVVTAKCVVCGHRHDYQAGDVPAGHHPMCPKCYGPMVAVETRITTKAPAGSKLKTRRRGDNDK